MLLVFWHKLLLSNIQISRFCEDFANGSSTNITLSKTQLHKIEQTEGFLSRPLGPLLKTGLPLTGSVLKPWAKSFFTLLGLTAIPSATDASSHKKMFGFGSPSDLAQRNTKLMILWK